MAWPSRGADPAKNADMEQQPLATGAGITPIFIVGMPRSGTTWVLRLLAAHPQAWPLVETYLLSRNRGLGALLAGYPPGSASEPEQASPDPGRAGLPRLFSREEMVAEVRSLAIRWLERGSLPGAHFVIDKSPWQLNDVQLIAEVLPEARFVLVVRDGRDVAASLAAARRSWAPHTSSGRDRSPVSEAARLWAAAIRAGGQAGIALGDSLIEVRYERLHADPSAEYARLLEHCDMPYDAELVRSAVSANVFERLGGSGEQRALRSGTVGGWRDELGLLDRFRFERLAGDELRLTGYEEHAGWWLRGGGASARSDWDR